MTVVGAWAFGEFLWAMVVAFFWVALLFTFIWVFIDNFRRRDHSGWAKAGWLVLILVLPLLGVLIYLIARPSTPEQYA
jgi:membrane protein DedA with SNARE-associated domain